MLALIVSTDTYLGANLAQKATDAGIRMIRTADFERIIRELKKPERMAIIDMTWEKVQEPGVLKQIVNVSKIVGNKVICMCPNQDEELKKIAKFSRADEVFIRYDMETTFKEYLNGVRTKQKKALS